MSKDMERKIIIIMLLYLVFLGISGCMAKPKASTKTAEQPNINVYNGTLSNILGCLFAPDECKKLKNKQSQKEPHQNQEEYQKNITEEMMEMDENISKDNK